MITNYREVDHPITAPKGTKLVTTTGSCISEVHIMTEESCVTWCEQETDGRGICGEIVKYEEVSDEVPEVSFLTVKEYLTGMSGNSFIPDLPQVDIDSYREIMCPKCANHEDLVLLALKEVA